MRLHGIQDEETGSPREILQLGYQYGFINDSTVWLLMLKSVILLCIFIIL